MKLPAAAFLWALIAEHGPPVKKLQRQFLGQSVRDKSARHAGRAFRAQRNAFAASVLERIHFLGDNIGRVAQRAGKHVGKLEDRRRNLAEAVELCHPPGSVFHMAVHPLFVGQEILGPPYGA